MIKLDQALEKSKKVFSDGEFITKLSSLVSLVTDSKNSISNDDLTNYYSKGLLGILVELGIQTKIIDNPTKINTSGVKVSFSREIKSVIIAGISFTLNPKESIIIDIAKTALIGSRKIFFKIDFIEILFFLFFIP